MSLLRRALLTVLLLVTLGPALVLTGLRLTQPGAGWAVRAVPFAPYALVGYALAGVLLGAVVVGALRRRLGAGPVTARLGALVLVLVLLVVHVGWLLPAFTGDRPAAAAGSPRLRVMTLNVLHDAGTGRVVSDAVASADADVVALQEVTGRIWRDLADTALVRTHPHVVGLDPKGRHGTVVMSREPLRGAERLATDGDCLVVRVRMGRRTVRLMAVHPRNPQDPALWRDDHAAVADAVREVRPAVVAGDFNATFDHAPMRRYRFMGYRSAAEMLDAGWQPTWPNNGNREVAGVPLPRLVHIDHVLVARTMTALSVDHLDVPLTDHMGVVAEVALR